MRTAIRRAAPATTAPDRSPAPEPVSARARAASTSRAHAGDLGVLDTGWTGQAHDATVVDEGKVTVSVTSCPGSDAGTRPCGVCSVSGPIANPNAAVYPAGPGGDINNRRCTNNSNVLCTSNAPCFQQCVGGPNDGVACAAARRVRAASAPPGLARVNGSSAPTCRSPPAGCPPASATVSWAPSPGRPTSKPGRRRPRRTSRRRSSRVRR